MCGMRRKSVECIECIQGECVVCTEIVWSEMSVFRESLESVQREYGVQ